MGPSVQVLPDVAIDQLEQQMLEKAIQASLENISTSNAESSAAGASGDKRPREEDGEESQSKRSALAVAVGVPPEKFNQLKDYVDGGGVPTVQNMAEILGQGDDIRKDSRVTDNAGPISKTLVLDPAKITTTLDDVYAAANVIDVLERVTISLREPYACSYGILSRHPTSGILLYGPPGTGKTLLVKAFAKQSKATFIALSGADVRSKFVGEGERFIKDVFTYARQLHPCVVFIDEAHSIFGRDSTARAPGHLDLMSQFLGEMDGVHSGANNEPIVIAATSQPFEFDEAILRRFGVRIMMGMPDVAARERILEIHLKGEALADDVSLADLAKGTDGYTGCDIKNLVVEAAFAAENERRCRRQALESPSSQTRSGWRRVLYKKHLEEARVLIPPSAKWSISKIMDFHTKFGRTQLGGENVLEEGKGKGKAPETGNTPTNEPEVYVFA